MKLNEFDYYLPAELIALQPQQQRDRSRLLHFEHGVIQDDIFENITSYLKAGDILVFNNSKVIPARLSGNCIGKRVEITLLKDKGEGKWQVLAKPAKKLVINEELVFAEDFSATILDKLPTGEVLLQFNKNGADLFTALDRYGSMPLPPYIEKFRKADKADNSSYQTVYAEDDKKGSVAAPTAGLHFTPELFKKLAAKGIETAYVTLHVGAGTFLPVRVEDISEHKMHSEYFEITPVTAEKINRARIRKGRVIAVGTTSLRTLESAADDYGNITAGCGETDIFIKPGYDFKLVDALVTNFHLPKSTLLILISAFVGLENARKIYRHAIDNRYRFFSYGDSSLLIRGKIVP